MSEKTKQIVITLIVVGAVIVFLFRDKISSLFSSAPDNGNQPDPQEPDVLKLGSTGELVKLLQQRLNSIIASHLTAGSVLVANIDGQPYEIHTTLLPDGKFGQKTLLSLVSVTGKPYIKISALDSLTDPMYMP